MKKLPIKHIIIAMIGTLWLLLMIVAYWLLYPYKILTDIQQPFVVLNENKKVMAGEYLRYEITLCKHNKLPAKISRYLSDGVVFSLSPFEGGYTNIDEGCTTNERTAQVPKFDFSSTPKKLIIILEYKPNPIRTVVYTFETEPFTITK